MAGGGGAAAGFDVALQRRQALMGASGPAALVKNGKVFLIAMFACLGGVLYGYNQGMFSGILQMPSFGKRMLSSPWLSTCADTEQRPMATSTTQQRRDGSLPSWNSVPGLEPSCLVSLLRPPRESTAF